MITENQLKQQCTDWLKKLSWNYKCSYNIALDSDNPKPKAHKEVFIKSSESV